MKRKWNLAILTCCIIIGLGTFPSAPKAGATEKSVLATTFPIFQIVRNVAQGRDGLRVDLMLPSQLGCPHDYALTPQDMQKLARADILVVNGLGMEEFLGPPVQKAHPQITVIDSSAGIEETLEYSEGHDQGHPKADNHTGTDDAKSADGAAVEPAARQSEHGHAHGHGEEHHDSGHDHHHAGVNPHLFVSPRMSARLAMNIAAGLSKADPDGAAIYAKNAEAYAQAMNHLADEMSDLGTRLKNNRIVQPHGIFDYLYRDMGLEIVAVMQAHGQEPSASDMLRIVKTIREKGAGAIFTEPQYPEKVGRSLSAETAIPVAMLDPVATGPENAPLGYYEDVMRRNMKTLESTLGVK